jgi:uncharacterized membrane protein
LDRARAIIAIYTVMGLVLMLIGVILSNQLIQGALLVERPLFYVLIVSAVVMLFIGLHWLIVGLASLRSPR